ncbi:response regulator [Flavobacterium sp.]|uniref:response regulator n=1 Tax=Flavobacterium sp. TaxID=239 RepID=UPI003D12C1F8
MKKSIVNRFEEAKTLLLTNDYLAYEQGNKLLLILEQELIAQKDYKQLEELYLEISAFHLTQYDYTTSKKVLEKLDLILKQHPDNIVRGSYYEHLSIFYNVQDSLAQEEKYTLLSEKYYTKYAPESYKVDMYYNLAILYLKKENWKLTLANSLKYLTLNEQLGGDKDQPEVFLFVAESFLKLNQLKNAILYLNKVEQSKFYNANSEDFLLRSRYFLVSGLINQKKGNYQLASEHLRIANVFFKKRLIERVVKTNQSLNQKRSLQLKNLEFQSIIKQNELKNENSRYKNYLLGLFLLIIVILLFFSYYQYRTAKFKALSNQLLDAKNNELLEALKIKKKLLDTFSHELRTPINTLSGNLHLLQKDRSNLDEQLEIMENAIQNLLNLSNTVIELHILEGFDTDYKPQRDKVVLGELIHRITDSIAKKRNYHLQTILNIDPGIDDKVWFDRRRLSHLLYCLIDNAFKFSKSNPVTVQLTLLDNQEDSTRIRFKIQDQGIGISDEVKSRILDLFVQGSEKINYEFGGSGLGLTLANRIIHLYNETLTIESELGKGTTVCFDLTFEKYKENEPTVVPISYKSDLKILLVEDNKVNQLMTKKIVVQKGFTCDIADNGLEAVKKVEAQDYDLILMDIMMPVMDGFEASLKITASKPEIPIVALTAVSETMNKRKFEECHIRKVLSKPVDVEELYNVILEYSA